MPSLKSPYSRLIQFQDGHLAMCHPLHFPNVINGHTQIKRTLTYNNKLVVMDKKAERALAIPRFSL